MIAYYKRELFSYFRTPIGWVALALYSIISGFYFASWLPSGGVDLSGEFLFLSGILFIVVPIITMRLFSEEKKSGTEVLMYTSPWNVSAIVIGKYFAALTLFILMHVSVFLHMFILIAFEGTLDAIAIGSFITLILLGAIFISVGTFASATTENQIISALITFTAILLSQYIYIFAQHFRDIVTGLFGALNVFGMSLDTINSIGSAVQTAINWIDPYAKMGGFYIGIFQLQSISYTISIVVFWLFVTYRLLEKRRWSYKS